MIEKILFIAAWVFSILGLLSFVLGALLQNDYDGSLEEKMDAFKGIRKSYKPLTKFGFWAFVISVIVLIANYL